MKRKLLTIVALALLAGACKAPERIVERRVPVPVPKEIIMVPDTTGFIVLEGLLDEAESLGRKIAALDPSSTAQEIHKATAEDVIDMGLFLARFTRYAKAKLYPIWFGISATDSAHLGTADVSSEEVTSH